MKGVVDPFYNALRHKLLKLDHKMGMVTIPIENRGKRIQQFETLLSQCGLNFPYMLVPGVLGT
jgi:hypothetical protein